MIVIGGSPKWTARHFKGRADIRGCMNSALVHKCKVSQAELLLEDSQDKKLVNQIHHPGEAILMTDFSGARLTKIPFCCRQDMEVVAQKIGRGNMIDMSSTDAEKLPTHSAQDNAHDTQHESVRNPMSDPVSVTHTHSTDAQPRTAERTATVR